MFESSKGRFASFLSLMSKFAQNFGPALTERFKKGRITTVEGVIDFAQTRSAYVAQTALYGYLKTRMGIRYPKVFEDEVMSKSIDLAKWRIFKACISDFAVFAVGTVEGDADANLKDARAMARHIFGTAIDRTFRDSDYSDLIDEMITAFDERSNDLHWANMGIMENAFTESPEDLVRWAPVIDEYKELDREIVTNSIRYRWRDVREQFRKRIDPVAVATDWAQNRSAAG